MMRGLFRGFERPPTWAAITLVVLGVGVPLWMALTWDDGRLTTAQIAAAQSSAAERDSKRTAEIEAEEPPSVLVIGDSYTGGSGEGGNGAANWTALVQDDLPEVNLQVAAAGGAGYTATSPITGETFVDLAEKNATEDIDLYVVFGSRNDGADPAAIGEAASTVYSTLLAASPDADLLVIGPPWVSGDVPDSVRAARDAVRDAARAVGATWLDPLAKGWFFDQPQLIGSDGVHPTDDGHKYMADRIAPVMEKMLAG